jgi:hypothetical protein
MNARGVLVTNAIYKTKKTQKKKKEKKELFSSIFRWKNAKKNPLW